MDLLRDFTERGIQLYNPSGEMFDTKKILKQIMKNAQGFDRLVLIQNLRKIKERF